jgi:hypothetical protein
MIGLALALVVFAAPMRALGYDDRGPSPDFVAWEVFTQVVADSNAAGAKELEFETWATDADLYESSPPQWPSGESPAREDCKTVFDRVAAEESGFPADGCIREEVRRNWAAFRYIVSHGLTSKAGFAKAFAQRLNVDLPADSIQVKADWVKISDLSRWVDMSEDEVRRIYYTRLERDAQIDTEYALVALHLNSKRWKNWLWATFEHRLNPGRCDELGCHDTFGAAAADIAPREPANGDYGDCQKTPSLIAMFANAGLEAVWLNYCLKGTQVAFAGKGGGPNRLGNSVIDRINGHIPIAQSSCMTCHALASFDRSGEANHADNAVGDVDQARLRDYLQNGFVWGVARAK